MALDESLFRGRQIKVRTSFCSNWMPAFQLFFSNMRRNFLHRKILVVKLSNLIWQYSICINNIYPLLREKNLCPGGKHTCNQTCYLKIHLKLSVTYCKQPCWDGALHKCCLQSLKSAAPMFFSLSGAQVGAKRTNRPGISTTDRGFPRARFRSRGGNFTSRARYYSGYTPPRGRGRAFRWASRQDPSLCPQCGDTL